MRSIWTGDAARQIADWPAAATAYRQALSDAPYLTHLWVQYGHMLREAGCRDEARAAYARSLALDPMQREPHHLLLDLSRAAGDQPSVLRHALAGFRLSPENWQAQALLLQSVSAGEPGHDAVLAEIIATIGQPDSDVVPAPPHAATLYIDVGDLIAHYRRSRLPSGLQRVQIEVACAALSRRNPGIVLCCWSQAAAAWKPLPGATFRSLVDAATGGGDGDHWARHLNAVLLGLAMAPPIAFASGSTLLNLGMAWGDPLYYPAVLRAKARGDLKFAAIACDVIPLVRPTDVPQDIVAACAEWLDALAVTADSLIAISQATSDDIVRVAAARGRPISSERIGVAPLDATFDDPKVSTNDVIARHGLVPGRFALYVSTIEPRKNHLVALAAWRHLMTESGTSTFDLVCVGRKGWRSEEVERQLAADRELGRRVHLLEGVTDADLGMLYDACALTFYPSLHEGWGLPITESLARGKIPVIGRNSSLPEAGGGFAVYVDATSPMDMANAIGCLVRDPERLASLEQAIRDDFRPRTWNDVADDMIAIALSSGPSDLGGWPRA